MIKLTDLTKDFYSTGEVARMIGRNYRTVNIHRKNGLINMTQDPLTKRWSITREDLIVYLESKNLLDRRDNRKGIVYARVSSRDQKENGDLDRQIGRLSAEAALQGPFEIITDVGSGLNAKKRGIQKLMDLICKDRVGTLYITHKDRLTRFGFEYLEKMCEEHNTDIKVLDGDTDKNAEEELVEDMMSLIASFSGKFYGMRSSRRKDVAKRAAAIIENQPAEK